MSEIRSKINPVLTLSYILCESENKWFDRKSAKVRTADIAPIISAFESPGRLPNIVTIENIRDTRYSRNPRIARVLSEFGWVRELNEGVKRIYSDMEKFFLDDPIYTEPEQSVRLVLKNNIVMRNLRKKDHMIESVGEEVWNQLDDVDHKILVYMSGKKHVNRFELKNYLDRSDTYIIKKLTTLLNLGIIQANGSKHDPKRTYSISNQ